MALVIFDVDGTLIDSQATILAAMETAFEGLDLAFPGRAATLSIVGLSLPAAIARLAPEADAARLETLVARYKAAFAALRRDGRGESAQPLYPGARAALERLEARGAAMAVATGKARRGLDHALDGHDLRRFFRAAQTADDAPSKPHPGMILNLLALTGATEAAMIGDTTYDMEMARAAGVRAIGVGWGYHPAEALLAAGAERVIERFEALDDALAARG